MSEELKFARKTLALVVPCYNEANRLNAAAFLKAVEDYPWLSVCFVDDGSTDATAETLARLSAFSPALHALYLERNVGKAEAVRRGMLHLLENSHAELVGFWDADLATPLAELPAFMRHFDEDPSVQAVIGSRWPHLGARISRSLFRGITGAAMKALIRLVLRAPVYDTQCGAKVFARGLAARIFARPFLSKWLFDVELLRRIGAPRLNRVVREQALTAWFDVPGSRLSILDSLRISGDLLRIAWSDATVV